MSESISIGQFRTDENYNAIRLNHIVETSQKEQNALQHQPKFSSNRQGFSILTRLKESVSQRPTFEQLMFLEQEKKHLWQLLALKQQAIERLQNKIKQSENNSKKLQSKYIVLQKYLESQLVKRDQLIGSLRQRERRLEKQLKRTVQIRTNIVEEMNLLKDTYRQQGSSLKPLYSGGQKQSLRVLHQTLKDQNTQLKQLNISLQDKNNLLHKQLDTVLKQLREIKVDVVDKFCLLQLTTNNKQNISLISNKQHFNIINNNNNLSLTNNKNNLSLNQNQIHHKTSTKSNAKTIQKQKQLSFIKGNKETERKQHSFRNYSDNKLQNRNNSTKKGIKKQQKVRDSSLNKILSLSERISMDRKMQMLRQLPLR